MATLTKYEGAAEVQIGGRTLAEATKARVSIRANDNKVNTMRKGFAGFSDGPTEAEVTIDTAVPKEGYEVDFWDAVKRKRELRVVIVKAGRRRTIVGRAQSLDEDAAENAAASGSVTIMGVPVGEL